MWVTSQTDSDTPRGSYFFTTGERKKKNQKVLTYGEAEAGAEWEGGDWAAGAWLPGLVALPDWPGLW